MTETLDPMRLLQVWLETKEPDWFLELKVSGTTGIYGARAPYYTISVGIEGMWLGWIDGPVANDSLRVLLWGHGAGHQDVCLKEPDSFERIHKFLKNRMPR